MLRFFFRAFCCSERLSRIRDCRISFCIGNTLMMRHRRGQGALSRAGATAAGAIKICPRLSQTAPNLGVFAPPGPSPTSASHRPVFFSPGHSANSLQSAIHFRSIPSLNDRAESNAYISRREVKVFGVEIFLYEWALTAKFLCDHWLSKLKIIYFSKRPLFCVC